MSTCANSRRMLMLHIALCLVAMLMLSLVAHADVGHRVSGRFIAQVQPGDPGDAVSDFLKGSDALAPTGGVPEQAPV